MDFLKAALDKRKEKGLLRTLSAREGLIDFCSNDYLGFSRDAVLQERISSETDKYKSRHPYGSTGSRLISGNTDYTEELEQFIASYHQAEAGLIFNSGYDANVGLFSSLPARGDTVLYDELIHASVRDGIRLSLAAHFSFRHNDLSDLESQLRKAHGTVLVGVESVYSMDGDTAPLKELASVCEKYGAHLIVDEAHATGIFGERGEGLVSELGLSTKVFARVHTFGKAIGSHGGIVTGSKILREYLVNFSRAFIYTTALPLHSLIAIKCAYNHLLYNSNKIQEIRYLINLFKDKIKVLNFHDPVLTDTPIQCLFVPGNREVKDAEDLLISNGFEVKAIMSPTVPVGKERIRISLHTFNTENELDGLVNTMKVIFANQNRLAV